jgi:SAM-dependent methyltransferase
MIRRLLRAWRAQAFNPSLLGAFVNPFFLARRGLWAEMVELGAHARGRLLDVGCGTQPYRVLFDVPEYIGLEIDSPEARERGVADAFYDGDQFPFNDEHFDTVVCNQVLEHVFNPDRFIAETCRVLKPGGRLLLTVPFVWDEHEQPYDFARYSSFGLRSLLERNGFSVIAHHKLLPDVSVIFQLLNAYLYKVLLSRRPLVNKLITAIVMAPISLIGLALGKVLPRNEDLFLDQGVVAERTR